MDTMALDRRYIAETYCRFPLEIVGGKGSVLLGADGREYLDMGGGIAVNLFGMGDEAWKNAVIAQLNTFQHTSNLYYSAPAAQLAQMLCERTGLRRVFFSNSGAEANECAIKVARKWAALHKGEKYCNIVTLRQSFHGRTLATLAATGQEVYHSQFCPLPEGFVSVPVGDADALDAVLTQKPCAAILFEAVQGEGGVRPIGAEYAQSLARLAEKHDVLLMADEVQLGNGRSGALYGYMNYGLRPDVVTTAKALGGGLPLGATLLGERAAEVFSAGDHGSTFGGNPVCCAGALNILGRIDEPLLRGVRERSDYIVQTLSGAAGIRSVSGMGLMLGLEIGVPAREFALKALEKGVLVTTAKDRIRLLPALNIPMEQLKIAVQRLKDCAAELGGTI